MNADKQHNTKLVPRDSYMLRIPYEYLPFNYKSKETIHTK